MKVQRFELTAPEQDSALWKRIEQHLQQRRDEVRARLESIELNEVQTAIERGRALALKEILELGRPPRPFQEPPPDSF